MTLAQGLSNQQEDGVLDVAYRGLQGNTRSSDEVPL